MGRGLWVSGISLVLFCQYGVCSLAACVLWVVWAIFVPLLFNKICLFIKIIIIFKELLLYLILSPF